MTNINTVEEESFPIDFGTRVRAARKILGITQAELGARLGGRIGNTVSRWENEEIVPDDPEIILLAIKGLMFEKYARELSGANQVFLGFREKRLELAWRRLEQNK